MYGLLPTKATRLLTSVLHSPFYFNPCNGQLLMPNSDSLLDCMLISFTDEGGMILSPQLDEDEAAKLGVSRTKSGAPYQGAPRSRC